MNPPLFSKYIRVLICRTTFESGAAALFTKTLFRVSRQAICGLRDDQAGSTSQRTGLRLVLQPLFLSLNSSEASFKGWSHFQGNAAHEFFGASCQN